MAKEYIERDDALNAIERSYWTEGAYERVERLPAADVVEVVHGRWEPIGNDWFDLWRCSACGTEWTFSYDPTTPETKVNYCSDCGARMDGE